MQIRCSGPSAIVLAALAACAPALRTPVSPVSTPAATEAVLRAQTQALLDAIAVGDRAVWERYVDPQVVYLSEAGEVQDRRQLLDELRPLPAGITGRITIGRFEVKQFGDTAVVLHADEEDEDYHGHAIHAQYLCIATWQHRGERWVLIAQQVLASLIDPPAIALPAALLDEYTGSYRLTDAIRYTIRRDGDDLVGERTGRPPEILRVEVRDMLFISGRPRSRKVFVRDAAGQVTGFADRREARDVVWTRITGS